MKIDFFAAIRMLVLLWVGLLVPLAWGQTIVTQTTDLSYAANDIFQWDLNGNTTSNSPVVYDQVLANNNSHTLSIASGALLNIVFGSGVNLQNSFWDNNQSWTVFNGFNSGNKSTGQFTLGSITGGANGYTLSANRPGAGFSISPVTNNNGTVTLNYTGAAFVPEPTSALAGILLAGGLLRRRR
jgi:hypothetical protein